MYNVSHWQPCIGLGVYFPRDKDSRKCQSGIHAQRCQPGIGPCFEDCTCCFQAEQSRGDKVQTVNDNKTHTCPRQIFIFASSFFKGLPFFSKLLLLVLDYESLIGNSDLC